MIKALCPSVRVIGVDPDEAVLAIARAKAAATGADIEWRQAMGDRLEAVIEPGLATKAVSSLVLHQCPMHMKRAIVGSMRARSSGSASPIRHARFRRLAVRRWSIQGGQQSAVWNSQSHERVRSSKTKCWAMNRSIDQIDHQIAEWQRMRMDFGPTAPATLTSLIDHEIDKLHRKNAISSQSALGGRHASGPRSS